MKHAFRRSALLCRARVIEGSPMPVTPHNAQSPLTESTVESQPPSIVLERTHVYATRSLRVLRSTEKSDTSTLAPPKSRSQLVASNSTPTHWKSPPLSRPWHALLQSLPRTDPSRGDSDAPTEKEVTISTDTLTDEAPHAPPQKDTAAELTPDKQAVLELAMEGASLFIGGKAGVGKSFLLRAIVTRLQQQRGLRVAVTASTGIAALQLGGNTFHSTFGVPVDEDEVTPSCHRGKRQSKQKGDSATESRRRRRLSYDMGVLSGVDVIVVDEVSLLHAGYLESLERTARYAEGRDRSKPFGGIQMILSGDFLQLTPFSGRGAAQAFRKDRDRITCAGVEPEEAANKERDIPQAGGKPQQCDEASADQPVGEKGMPPCAIRPTDDITSVPRGAKRKAKTVAKRKSATAYQDMPMYDSYVFQHCLLHVQLGASWRHNGDAAFAADLNRLRRGLLPFRLSRSAVLNKEDPEALRLFAAKRAVRAYNASKLMLLNGEERLFRSQLFLSSMAKEAYVGLSPHEQAWSDTILLHLCRPTQRYTATLSAVEARAIVEEVCEAAKVPPYHLHWFVLPRGAAGSLAASTTRVAVRCTASTLSEANERLQAVRSVAAQKIQQADHPSLSPAGHVPRKGSGSRKASSFETDDGAVFRSAPRWAIVRQERSTPHHLVHLAQSAFQQRFRKTIQNDFILQDKWLKVGCRVMLLRNLNTSYVNGSLGKVVAFAPLRACASLIPHELKVMLPPRHFLLSTQRARPVPPCEETVPDSPPTSDSWDSTASSTYSVTASSCEKEGEEEEDVTLPIVLMEHDQSIAAIPWVTLPVPGAQQAGFFSGRVVCLPLTPAYAFTVHKIQGVTFDHSVLFDAADLFPCDHLVYVAASRVKAFHQLRMINLSPRMITVHRPSLSFCDALPRVSQAMATWEAWKVKNGLGVSRTSASASDPIEPTPGASSLFWPSWAEQYGTQ